jgi:cellulase
MDIWEANSRATVFTPHTCSGVGSFLCAGEECSRTGVCDKPGCGFNPYASGSRDFYGPGMNVDSSRPFTVVTQFITSDNTAAGELVEIRRIYIQDGAMIDNAPLMGGADPAAISQPFCTDRNSSDFLRLGGIPGMGKSLARGMVLIFSIWNSEGDFMTWLDSGNSGPCSTTEGDPKLIVDANPSVSVTFSNVKWGEIGSTFSLSSSSASSSGLASTQRQSQSSSTTLKPIAMASIVAMLFSLIALT